MQHLRFNDCGCEFEINENGGINFSPFLDDINLDCSRTWKLICDGNTKGIFQLSSILGKSLASRLKPHNIEQLAALTAIMRPGSLECYRNGKSVTNHYIDKKNGNEVVDYYHPALKTILESTYGEMCIDENTFISMGNGEEKYIKDIKPQELVCSLNLDNNQIEIDKCIHIEQTRHEYGYILKLENGFSVVLTYDHKVWTNYGWVPVEKLNINQHVIATALKQPINYIDNKGLNNISCIIPKLIDQFYIMGQYVGDGCGGKGICTGTKTNHNKLLAWLQKNTNLCTRPYYNVRSWYIGISHKKLLNSSYFGNRKIMWKHWLEQHGLHLTRNKKNIPKIVFMNKPEYRRAFLAGLLDSDGHIGTSNSGNTCIINYCSNNNKIINGIRKLLSLDGIATYISSDYKYLHIRNVQRFIHLVGPYLVIKNWQNKGDLLDDISYGSVLAKSVKEKILQSNRSIRSYFNNHKSFSRRSIYGSQFCGQWISKAVGINHVDLAWMRVKSIQKTLTKHKFYRISIQNNHNLVGNGIIIKNCYQEQSMQIAQKIAGFNLQEADVLRKAIGKKRPEIMAKVKKQFLKGCKKQGIVTQEQAEEIFGWIEKSQRYSFNKSHAVSYAMNAYLSAFVKAHFPRDFFMSYLSFAYKNPDTFGEIHALINNARNMSIDIFSPDLRQMNNNYDIIDNNIYIGLANIRGIGDSTFDKLEYDIGIIEKFLDRKCGEWTWIEILVHLSPKVDSAAMTALISSGALNYLGLSRQKMKYEYKTYKKIRGRELPWCVSYITGDNFDITLQQLLTALYCAPTGRGVGAGCSNKNRKEEVRSLLDTLNNAPHDLSDDPTWISEIEDNLLGAPVTCAAIDAHTYNSNSTCREFVQNIYRDQYIIAVQVENAHEKITRKKQKMGYATVSDLTGCIDRLTVFAGEWEKCKKYLIPGNTVLIIGNRSRDGMSFILQEIKQI